MPDDPRVDGLSDAAFRLHVRSLLRVARLRPAVLPFASAPYVLAGQLVRELIAAGAWSVGPSGYELVGLEPVHPPGRCRA